MDLDYYSYLFASLAAEDTKWLVGALALLACLSNIYRISYRGLGVSLGLSRFVSVCTWQQEPALDLTVCDSFDLSVVRFQAKK